MSEKDDQPKKDEEASNEKLKDWKDNLDDSWSVLVASGKGGGDGAVY